VSLDSGQDVFDINENYRTILNVRFPLIRKFWNDKRKMSVYQSALVAF